MDRAEWVTSRVRRSVRDLKPYYQAPLEGRPLRLDQNTNLDGPHPAVAAVQVSGLDIAQYPTRDADRLRQALSDFHGLPADRFLATNGSDEALDLLVKTFTEPGGTLAVAAPSYSLYPFYARIEGLRFVEVPMRGNLARRDGFRPDVDALLQVDADLTVAATPNNPTGACWDEADLTRLLAESTGIVVVDEAYIEYAGLSRSLLSRIDEHDNLVVLRTFSKAYGLAGLRIGVLAANKEVANRLRRTKPPYNLNVFSEAVAVAALDDPAWVDDHVARVRAQRDVLRTGLSRLGFHVHPSDANFLLCRSPVDPGLLQQALREAGILVRTFPGRAGLEEAVRFGVGRPEDVERLLAVLPAAMEAA